jgi:hypothetical protein
MNKNKVEVKPWSLLIYGQPKIGLSTLASSMPDPLFLNLDDHLTHLKDVKEIDITCWQDFITAGAEISDGKQPSQTLVVSHTERLWGYVCDHLTKTSNGKNGTTAQNIAELSFAEWRMAIDLFEKKLAKLMSLRNTILLSHEIAEARNVRGVERIHFMANLERKVQLVVLNLVDAVGRLYSVEQDLRILSFVSQENQVTGSRIPMLQNRKFVIQDRDVSPFIRVIETMQRTHQSTRGTTHDSRKSHQKGSEGPYAKRNPAHAN